MHRSLLQPLAGIRLIFAAAAAFAPPGLAAGPAEWLADAREDIEAPAMGLVLFDLDGVRALAVNGKRAKGAQAPVEEDDPWHLGSNTKAMTALLAAVLEARGEIDFDDRLGPTLDESIEDIHPDWSEVDYPALLAHCSGLPANASRWQNLMLMGDEGRDDRADRIDYLDDLLGSAPATPPGGAFEYSNAGYVAAGAMLEASTAEDWKALMQREIFEPLGLDSAGFGPPGSAGHNDAPRGHSPGLFGGLSSAEPGATADNPPALNPAGRVHMNLADYAALGIEFLRGLRGDGRLLDAAAYRRLTRPRCSENYALGWGVLEDGTLAHSGSNTMWLAQIRLWPDSGRGMVVVSNDGRIERQRPVFSKLFERGRAWLADQAAADSP